MLRESLAGHLLTCFTITVWGATFISSKILLRDFIPIEILFDRFLLGFIAMWIIFPHIMRVKSLRHEIIMAIAGLFGITLYFLCENIALVYSKAANVGVIIASVPFFTGLVDRLLGTKRKLPKGFFLGFIIAMTGICLLTFSSLDELSFNPIGDGLAVLASVMWAFYCLFINKALSFGYKPLQVTRHVFAYGLIFMLIPMYFMEYEFKFEALAKPVNYLNLLFLGLCASALCYVTWSLSVKLIGTVKASAWLYISPAVTVIMAILILDETVSGLGIFGMLLTFLGLIISQNGIKGIIRLIIKRHEVLKVPQKTSYGTKK